MDIEKIALSSVTPSPMNPRKTFDEGELKELSANIEKQGLLQPITIRPVEGGPTPYEIVCGERRYRAYKMLHDYWSGLGDGKYDAIPAIIREMTDDEAFDAMITENLQRKNVDPIEEAFSFGQLVEKGQDINELAARFGKSVRYIQDRVKLNSLIPELTIAVKDEKMSISAAQIICKLNESDQKRYYTSYEKSPRGFSRETATSYTDNLFMHLRNAPWWEKEKSFIGGCGRSCGECAANTNNHGCLFWEMKGEEKDAKCTSREGYNKKRLAYILAKVEEMGDAIVKAGDPLELGKTVIVEEPSGWVPDSTRDFKKEAYEALRAQGYEVVQFNEVFEGYCYYEEKDERTQELLAQGRVYRVLPFFSYESVNTKTKFAYIKNWTAGEGEQKGASQSLEVVKLLEKRRKTEDGFDSKLGAEFAKIAEEIDIRGLASEDTESLATEESIAVTMFLLARMGYSDKLYQRYEPLRRLHGEPLWNYLAEHPEIHNTIILETIRSHMRSVGAAENRDTREIQKHVLPLWEKEKYEDVVKAQTEARDKRLAGIDAKLRDLGYDSHGNRLEGVSEEKVGPSLDKKREEQYAEMKKSHPDAVLLFRIGDFYEAQAEDAEKVSDVLGLTVSRRGNTKLCGFPHQALDQYLPKLVRAGHLIAICEQKEE